MISIEQIDNLLRNSGTVLDRDGHKIGKVEQVFVGDDSQQPEWVTAKTGLFGHSETYIPLREASADGDDIRVPYDKDQIKNAPRTENTEGHLAPGQEAELFNYYGLESDHGGVAPGGASRDGAGQDGAAQDADAQSAGPQDAGAQSAAGHDTGPVPGVQEPVRHDGNYGGGYDQDLLQDGDEAGAPAHQIRNAEGVRLRKYTVTEHVTMSVPVEREEVEVVPDPEAGTDRRKVEPEPGAAPGAYPADQAESGPGSGMGDHHRHRAGDEQPQSEGFGENYYDQLRGPQSEDPRHPRGTVKEDAAADRDARKEGTGDGST